MRDTLLKNTSSQVRNGIVDWNPPEPVKRVWLFYVHSFKFTTRVTIKWNNDYIHDKINKQRLAKAGEGGSDQKYNKQND